MQASGRMFERIGGWLAAYLSHPIRGFAPLATYSAAQLRASLEPADVLLVEGNLRISTAIKYLTQSTWSHAALYVGPQPIQPPSDDPPVSSRPRSDRGRSCRRLASMPIFTPLLSRNRVARRGSQTPRRPCTVAARPRLRPDECVRPGALSAADAAGSDLLAAPHARVGQRRTDSGDLFHPHRASLPERGLSHSANTTTGAPPRPAA